MRLSSLVEPPDGNTRELQRCVVPIGAPLVNRVDLALGVKYEGGVFMKGQRGIHVGAPVSRLEVLEVSPGLSGVPRDRGRERSPRAAGPWGLGPRPVPHQQDVFRAWDSRREGASTFTPAAGATGRDCAQSISSASYSSLTETTSIPRSPTISNRRSTDSSRFRFFLKAAMSSSSRSSANLTLPMRTSRSARE